jgi:hypothetical protein
MPNEFFCGSCYSAMTRAFFRRKLSSLISCILMQLHLSRKLLSCFCTELLQFSFLVMNYREDLPFDKCKCWSWSFPAKKRGAQASLNQFQFLAKRKFYVD